MIAIAYMRLPKVESDAMMLPDRPMPVGAGKMESAIRCDRRTEFRRSGSLPAGDQAREAVRAGGEDIDLDEVADGCAGGIDMD